jgi:hypothetical protein
MAMGINNQCELIPVLDSTTSLIGQPRTSASQRNNKEGRTRSY